MMTEERILVDPREVVIRLRKLAEKIDDKYDRWSLEAAIQTFESQILELPRDFFDEPKETKQ